jgi:hypothetical protein
LCVRFLPLGREGRQEPGEEGAAGGDEGYDGEENEGEEPATRECDDDAAEEGARELDEQSRLFRDTYFFIFFLKKRRGEREKEREREHEYQGKTNLPPKPSIKRGKKK